MPIPTSDNPIIQAAIALLHYHNTNEIDASRTHGPICELFETLVTAGYAVNPQGVGWYGGPVLKGHPYLKKLQETVASRRNEAQREAESFARGATQRSEEATRLNALLLELSE